MRPAAAVAEVDGQVELHAQAVAFPHRPLHAVVPLRAQRRHLAVRRPPRPADLHPSTPPIPARFMRLEVGGDPLLADVAVDPEPEDPRARPTAAAAAKPTANASDAALGSVAAPADGFGPSATQSSVSGTMRCRNQAGMLCFTISCCPKHPEGPQDLVLILRHWAEMQNRTLGTLMLGPERSRSRTGCGHETRAGSPR